MEISTCLDVALLQLALWFVRVSFVMRLGLEFCVCCLVKVDFFWFRINSSVIRFKGLWSLRLQFTAVLEMFHFHCTIMLKFADLKILIISIL